MHTLNCQKIVMVSTIILIATAALGFPPMVVAVQPLTSPPGEMETSHGGGDDTIPTPAACGCLPDDTITLRVPPAKNRDVRNIQVLLLREGFSPGSIDGIYGPRTKAAVQAFQRHHGLRPDGIVGPLTWHALASVAPASPALFLASLPDGAGQAARLPLQERSDAPPQEPGQSYDQPEEPLTLVIDTEERTLTVYSRGRPFKRYVVAVGKPSTPSPPGEWTVVKKSSWSGGFGTRWMGLDVPWGIYGIHGTNKPWSIGDAVSGGCIRMHNQHVEELFQWVKTGTRVKIIGHPYDPLRNPRRLLGPGERGADVLLAERRLARLGYKVGKVDGVYDDDTVKAVKEFQRESRLRVTGEITQEVYDALGMYLFE